MFEVAVSLAIISASRPFRFDNADEFTQPRHIPFILPWQIVAPDTLFHTRPVIWIRHKMNLVITKSVASCSDMRPLSSKKACLLCVCKLGVWIMMVLGACNIHKVWNRLPQKLDLVQSDALYF